MMENQNGTARKLIHYLNFITVEPTLVLYMLAFMTTSVVEHSFYIYKACIANHGFNKTICENLHEPIYKNITTEVQSTTAVFHIWNNISGHVVPVILALFMGAWSDKRGRKLPLLIGLIGKTFFSVMIVVNTLQTHWPVEYIIFTATLPSALTGADVTIFASAFTYLIDISSIKNRTMRITILEVFYLATMPIGVAVGSYLFKNVVNRSYTYMFVINSSLMFLSVIYSALRLKSRTNSKQRPLSEAPNKFFDFFDYNHLTSTIKVFTQKRQNNKRTYLWLLILMMALYTFQRDERETMYMYCQYVFNWTIYEFSKFRTAQSALQDVVLLCAIPIMSRVFGWRDTLIIMIGAIAHTTARIFYASAHDVYVFYTGGIFASVGPIVAPVIRSLVSKIVTISEKGKAFSILAVADNAIPLVSGTFYNALYNSTILFNPASIFYLTMATQIGVFCLVVYIHLTTDKNTFETEEKVVENGDIEETHSLQE